jgi:hypothetical protein
MKIIAVGVLSMVFLLGGGSEQTEGTLFYSNFTTPSSGGAPVQCGQTTATRWTTGAGYSGGDTWLFNYAEINIELLMGSSDDLAVYLYTYNGSPNQQVAELYASQSIGAQANYSFFPSESVYLTPNTLYCLVVEPAFVGGTQFSWHYAPDWTGAAYSEANGTTWGPWENGTDAPTVRVYGEVVPEPATLALFGLGGLLCLWRVNRRRR